MPLQNRVNPDGTLRAYSSRGLLMGNRGCLHHASEQILTKKQWTTKSWIICVCEFKGRKRSLMSPGKYTELFFLDEASALAAGHRPCFECQRERANQFKHYWCEAFGKPDGSFVKSVDKQLHHERYLSRGEPLQAITTDEIKAGDFVKGENGYFTKYKDILLRWDFAGYQRAKTNDTDGKLFLVTPPSMRNILASGFEPLWHPSAKMHWN